MKNLLVTGVLCFFLAPQLFSTNSVLQKNITEIEKEAITNKARNLKLPWVENNGRYDEAVLYYTGTDKGNVYVTASGEIVYQTVYKTSVEDNRDKKYCPLNKVPQKEEPTMYGNVWRESFVKGKIETIVPQYISPSTVSYFTGKDPSKWEAGKRTYYSISLGQIWKNIEVKLNKNANSVEKRFYIYPGGNANNIVMQLAGCEKLVLADDGSIVTYDSSTTGKMSFSPPVAYQYISGKKISVPVHYLLKGNTYGFQIAPYNPGYTLIIDPLLSNITASTYIGGSYYDYSNYITTDDSGNVYIASATLCTNYPVTVGAYQTSNAGNLDAYVSKFNSNLTTLLASTYLGGNSNDQAMFVTVASSGAVFVTGQTLSTNFPTTAGAYQSAYGGGDFDDFISKFNPGLTQLLASTYLGGSGDDLAYAITFDDTGALYLAGFTSSSNFPATAGAYSTALQGSSNAFITKMDPNLSTIKASTFIGGSSNDYAYAIARDAVGNLYITGQATSSDYPVAGTPYQAGLNGASDTYVSKMNGALSNLLASTFLGGSGGEQSNDIVLDHNGDVYLTGWESSSDFPVTAGAYQAGYGGGQNDAYISRLDNNLTNLLASTYLGGSSDDYGYGLAVDGSGNVYVSGFTGGNSASSNFPTTAGAFQQVYGGGYYDAFVSILDTSLTALQQSTFVGGNGSDFGYYLALSAYGNLYICGQTQSTNFPTTAGAYQTYNAGAADVFVTKFGNNLTIPPPVAIFSINDSIVCTGDSVSFTDQSTGAPTSRRWTFIDGTPGTSILENPKVLYDASGLYSIKLVVSNSGGADSITQSVHITVNAAPVAGTITGPAAVCPESATQLTDTGSTASIQWQSSINGISFINIPGDTTATNNISGIMQNTYYRVNTSNSCGFDSSAVYQVMVKQLPDAGVITGPDAICAGNSVQLSDTGNTGNIQWQSSNDGTTFLNLMGDSTSTDTTGTLTETIYYRVMAYGNCGPDSSAAFKLVVYPLPEPLLETADSLICSGDSTLICVPDTFKTYLWSTTGDTSFCTTVKLAGGYWVTVTDANGCSAISEHQYISVYPVPSVSISVHGDTLTSFYAVSYQWFFNDTMIPNATDSVYIALKTGNYAVQVTDINGCNTYSINTPVVVSGIEDFTNQNGLIIYPDPFSNIIFIKESDRAIPAQSIELYNVLGEMIMNKKFDNSLPALSLDVSSLAPGSYYLLVRTDNSDFVKMMIKE